MTADAVAPDTALRRAAVRATLAPSVHNTQPWWLHLPDGRLDLHVDRSRQLAVVDPTSRQMLISCGCAIMNARVSLAGSGLNVKVRRNPHPGYGDLLASLTPTDGPADEALAALDPAIEARTTNRGQFDEGVVPDSVLHAVCDAAAAEVAFVHVVRDPRERALLATLGQRAADIENLNPAHVAERRAWTLQRPSRDDGSLPPPVPPLDGAAENEALVLLCTTEDSATDWLRAGEALERMWLEITRRGYRATPHIEIVEVPSIRAELAAELKLSGYVHLLLRIGQAPAAPPSRRRRLVEVLIDES